MRDHGMEIQRHSLAANADDDPMAFRILGDQLGLVRFFLNGYNFWFAHADSIRSLHGTNASLGMRLHTNAEP